MKINRSNPLHVSFIKWIPLNVHIIVASFQGPFTYEYSAQGEGEKLPGIHCCLYMHQFLGIQIFSWIAIIFLKILELFPQPVGPAIHLTFKEEPCFWIVWKQCLPAMYGRVFDRSAMLTHTVALPWNQNMAFSRGSGLIRKSTRLGLS